MRRVLAVFMLSLVAAGASADAAKEPRAVDLELVLAVDNSFSINEREYALQISGIAAAFEDPAVIDAILAHRGVAVVLMLWANHEQQAVAVDWSLLADRRSIRAFARRVAAVPRIKVSGGTGIGPALRFALGLFDGNGFAGGRRVIDISGDGQHNMGIEPDLMRDRAVALGVTINGLAILDEEPHLDAYYAKHVIGGPGAFLAVAETIEVFAEAIRRKLLREFDANRSSRREPGAIRAQDGGSRVAAARTPEGGGGRPALHRRSDSAVIGGWNRQVAFRASPRRSRSSSSSCCRPR